MSTSSTAIAIIAAVAFAISLALTPAAALLLRRAGFLDVPNARSSHRQPTPRGGGIAMVTAIILVLAWSGALSDRGIRAAISAAIVIAIVSFIDDKRHLPPLPKFIVHVAAGGVAIYTAGLLLSRVDLPFAVLRLSPVALIASVFFAVGWINAYNFMDGVNGIAAAQAITAGVTLTLLFSTHHDAGGAAVACAIAAAAAGFLPWNFPKARVFMGDVGSAPLGFLFAVLILRANSEFGLVPATLPLFPFLFDASVTLVRRMARRERFFHAHRTHFYQQLSQVSGSHVVATAVWSGLAILSSIAALAYPALSDRNRLLVLLAVAGVHTAVAIAIWRVKTAMGGAYVASDG
ncbi:MAG TPA: glycosyltransferase family 4 protein [Thermoanaerobaculia bacterium]|nr:glycosyltransferase family 4 protein [Thermoanaerobaculia bacterium]